MPVGYPDFQTYPTWTGPFTNDVNEPISNLASFSQTVQLGNFASLFIFTNSPSFGTTVSVLYYTDSTMTVSIGGYSWTMQATTVLEVIVPNLGPFAKVSIGMTQTGSQNVSMSLIPLNTPIPRCMYPRQNNRVGQSTSVPLSTTVTFNLPQTMEGTLYASFIPGDAAGKLTYTVQEALIDGTAATPLISAPLITAPAYFTSAANNQPLQVAVTNTDAAGAHPCKIRVQVLPAA